MKSRAFFSIFLTASLVLLATAAAFAQAFDYNDFGITVEPKHPKVPAGRFSELVITIDVPFGMSITDVEGVLEIKPMNTVEGVTFGKLIKPEPDKVDEVGGHFTGVTTFRLPFTVDKDAKPGIRTIVLGFRLQACDEETGVCHFPSDPEDLQRSTEVEILK